MSPAPGRAAPTDAPFVPIVPAGGSGTRLWPLSRRERPKFLLDLTGQGSSLLQQTIQRVLPLADRPPIVVTGASHAEAVREQLGDEARILLEPSPRSSMPAIALAAAVACSEDPDAVIGSFAADHRIDDAQAFVETVRRARAVADLGLLVTIGIEPTGPSTGFGYIEAADPADQGDRRAGAALRAEGAVAVSRFVEKPDRATAQEFCASGRFRWNAGMFVVRAQVLLAALDRHLPLLASGAREIAAAFGTDSEAQVLDRVWPTMTSISIDHALAEPLAAEGAVAMVPGAFGWDDVGDFAALARQLRAAAGPSRSPGGETGGAETSDVLSFGGVETVAIDASGTVYGSSGRLVALVGVDGVSVVETEDALLILGDGRAQDLSRITELLERTGHEDLR